MARQSGLWNKIGDVLKPAVGSGVNILIVGLNKYINFNVASGEDGYGIRDNNGTIEIKNQSGAWGSPATSAPTWDYYATNWSVAPTLNSSITGGDVYNYTLNGTTKYRFVPTTYDATEDAFYTTFSSGVLSGIIVTRG